MFSWSYNRRGALLTSYETAVLAYRAAVHAMLETSGAEFRKARVKADRLRERCKAARDALKQAQ